MGAYDPANPKGELAHRRGDQLPWVHQLPMDGGAGGGSGGTNDLADRLAGLAVRDVPDDSLIQVMRAVEDAENTIRKQLEENNQLKNELMQKTRELERYRLDATTARHSEVLSNDHTLRAPQNHISNSSPGNVVDTNRWLDDSSSIGPRHMLVIHQNGVAEREEPSAEANIGNQHYYETSNPGALRKIPGAQSGFDSAGPSQLSTPSSRSLSPNKHRKEAELDSRLNVSGSGLMPVSESNTNLLWKQELIYKVREHEEEIAQLRKHLADYSVKEAQIRNEKYVLEKRIAYMRMAFDQQQQDLVDAASKAISYRQEIIEENIRLTYALQAAQAERSTFVSSLLPLLSEYRLEPAVHDAQSIVRNLKVLFRHMQEKLIFAEEKLKESQYQLAPWHAESSNNTRTSPQSPSHPLNAPLAGPSKNSLELVPQTAYQHAASPTSSPANFQKRHDWDILDDQTQQTGPSSAAANNADLNKMVKTNLSASRNTATQEAPASVNQSQPHADRFSFESGDQNPSFKDLVRVNKTDDSETSGAQHEREPSVHWAPRNSPYLSSGQDDPNSFHYLPPVLEEPSSSFSEAADDDPLPAIEGLRISGDAYPGRELQASGYSINGTTSCNFEWVRYLEDGSVNYIDGAKQPTYVVNADDVESYLAIEVQPLDDRKRKGELVKVFANDQRKITCDPEAQEQIKKALSVGHVSYEVSLSARFLDIWEPAILAIKREGYSIKCNGPRGIVAIEKFKPATNINISYGHPMEFFIQDDSGDFLLKTAENGRPRDTIVLIMRLFKMMAAEKRKGKKRGLFFK